MLIIVICLLTEKKKADNKILNFKFKFQADNKNVNFPTQFCLGNISNKFGRYVKLSQKKEII